MNHMSQNNLFSNKQFGFLKGRSTTLQLLTVLDSWTDALDSGSSIDVVYTDFQKAFDRVPHQRLLNKLKANGIEGSMEAWIRSFLLKRRQKVTVNGEESQWQQVKSGIPQGTVLGPFLFLLYINDLPDFISTNIYLYADDAKLFNIINNQHDISTLQSDITALEDWSNLWQLNIHPGKCKYMHDRRGLPANPPIHDLQLNHPASNT